jgi:hypothetical protein
MPLSMETLKVARSDWSIDHDPHRDVRSRPDDDAGSRRRADTLEHRGRLRARRQGDRWMVLWAAILGHNGWDETPRRPPGLPGRRAWRMRLHVNHEPQRQSDPHAGSNADADSHTYSNPHTVADAHGHSGAGPRPHHHMRCGRNRSGRQRLVEGHGRKLAAAHLPGWHRCESHEHQRRVRPPHCRHIHVRVQGCGRDPGRAGRISYRGVHHVNRAAPSPQNW